MDIHQRIAKLIPFIADLMIHKKWQVALAESCTGGGLASTLTSLSGSSKWFNFGLVTYSNEAKIQYLNVSDELLKNEGAVSQACALAMIKGLGHENFFRLAITGFAGPEGDDVGEVYMAWQAPDQTLACQVFNLKGSRRQIISQVIYQSLRQMAISSLYPFKVEFNCFFALYLDDASLQQQCLITALELGLSVDELEPFNNLHVTLAYLGHQTTAQLKSLKQKGDDIQNIAAFDLILDVCEQWPRAHCLVLKAQDVPKSLEALVNQLPQAQDTHEFVPHVTIAKRQALQMAKQNMEKIHIPVKSFSLMLSFHGIFYLEYYRWNLNKGE
jgi:nicotinamide-nucleotide amidase